MEVLKGHAALVSGASRGIGLATGIALSEAGASVAFNYYDQQHEAPAAVQRITDAGGKAILVQGDVAELSAVVEGGNRRRQGVVAPHGTGSDPALNHVDLRVL